MYSVILTELNTESDLKAIVGAISSVLSIDKRGAVEKAKNLPLILAENLPKKEAKLMADMFSGMGAGIKVSPPLDAAPAKPLREMKSRQKGIPFGCLAVIMLCLVGFAVFASLKYEWIVEQVEERLKPSPEKAEKLLQKGKMSEAKQSIHKQLREKPNDTELLILQGKYYIGIARQRMDGEHWKTYGEANALPELDTAISVFRKAETLNPNNGSILRWISHAEQMRLALPEAETAARRALSIDPQDPDNWNQLGSVLLDSNQVSQAEQAFYNALKIDPNNAAALRNLAVLNLYHTQDAARAAGFLFNYLDKKEAVMDMDSYKLRTDLATAMIGDFNPPLEKLSPVALSFNEYEKKRRQITDNPQLKNDPLLQEELGLLYMAKGENVVAEDCFVKAIRLNAKMEISRKMLAIMYLKEPNYERALKIMQAAADNGARDPFFWKNIGFLQKYYKANPVEANKAFNRYFALGGDSYGNRVKKEMY
jgi:Flp pilus assembly protein TadD